ncbi:MAG: LL-diaminopimelate aminotransferase [Chlamydiales bacterium]|nr:LL-diaminopimelate aminotransferase [Chlamydiales bacterium]
MVKRNTNLAALKANYLFPEINLRRKQFLVENPEASIVNLGIGDTTEPIGHSVIEAFLYVSKQLGTLDGYSGYGPEQGIQELRKKIAEKIYSHCVKPEEVFVSDGAKCDLGRLQMLFGNTVSIAVQDPAYPVYIDGSLIQGVQQVIFMPCLPENQFFPNLEILPRTDLIYFCSPNNPTGAAATKEQLEQLVAFAIKNRSIIIFDAAYASYIQDPSLPKSIFEIENAKQVAIEVNSFSKLAGFTGVRLGWTVVPEDLKYEDGTSVKADWNRLTTTIFNGASNIAQRGGCRVLEEDGLLEIKRVIQYYLENARIIKEKLESLGYSVFGGTNAPYLWVHFPGKKSWEVFQQFLEKLHLVTTPGAGFGPSGEGFLRLTAFGHRKSLLEAMSRLDLLHALL